MTQPHVFKSSVYNVRHRDVEIRLDRGERIPLTDLHHRAWIHVLVDEKPLGEAATEIVTADVSKIVVTRIFGSSFGRSFHDSVVPTLGEIDNRRAELCIRLLISSLRVTCYFVLVVENKQSTDETIKAHKRYQSLRD